MAIDFDHLLVGWEIETGIKCEGSCDGCDYSHVCEYCDRSPCDWCRGYEICEVCDMLRDYLADRGVEVEKRDCKKCVIYVRFPSEEEWRRCFHRTPPRPGLRIAVAPRKRRTFCTLCRYCYLYDHMREEMCENCNPCDYCDGPPDADPYDVAVSYGVNTSEFERIYVDGSCGLEFSTLPFRLLEFYWRIRPEWRKLEMMDPDYGCGNHVNISYHPYASNHPFKRVVMLRSAYFLDLFAYMFLLRNTNMRSPRYRYFDISELKCLLSDEYRGTDKYHFLNVKDWREPFIYEFRWPDGARFFNVTYLATIANAIMVVAPREKVPPVKAGCWKQVESVYNAVIRRGPAVVFRDGQNVPAQKFDEFLSLYRDEIREFSSYLGFDVRGAFEELFETPAWMRSHDVRMAVRPLEAPVQRAR